MRLPRLFNAGVSDPWSQPWNAFSIPATPPAPTPAPEPAPAPEAYVPPTVVPEPEPYAPEAYVPPTVVPEPEPYAPEAYAPEAPAEAPAPEVVLGEVVPAQAPPPLLSFPTAPASAVTRNERETLLAALDERRAALAAACQGLDAEQLASRAVPPSQMSMLGIVRHLTAIEYHWFRRVLGERLDLQHLWPDDPTGGFRDVLPTREAVQEAWEGWSREVAHARQIGADLPDEVFGVEVPKDGGGHMSVRALVVHMVEEYARHLGHADLLRERLLGHAEA